MTPAQPNWEQLRSYLAVIRTKSLSGAARELGTTQPTVGRHIDALEESLATSLFVRSRYGLTPTAAALDLLPHVETMASAAAALTRTASGKREETRGTIRVTASEIVGTEILPASLARFRRKHPLIDIELVVANQTDNLLKREADIAVRMFRPEQTALVAIKIGDTPIGLFAHRSYIKRRGVPTEFDELESHCLIGHDSKIEISRALVAMGIPVHRGQLSYRCDSEPAQHALIRAGAGIGGMQKVLAAHEPALIPIMPERVHIPMEMWLVMHEDLRSVRRVRLLFDFLRDRLHKFVL